jgi:uncharacterized membrane protein YsdA (DUF1294 family)/cold shock CspA family protein
MRYQGKITGWQDDRGFGFVAQNSTGEKAFAHINAFVQRGRRPADGDIVTYALTVDRMQRKRAEGIRFLGEETSRKAPAAKGTMGTTGTVCTAIFCGMLGVAALQGWLPSSVAALYLGLSCIAFLAYGRDKAAAKANRHRTAESTLLLLGLAGGWPGALLAQRVFRHKSAKVAFQTAFRFTVMLNCCALALLLWPPARALLRSMLTS